MNRTLYYIKKLIPRSILSIFLPSYHYVLGYLAALRYKFPSREMIVVGVTGTTGKTTTIYLAAKILQEAGFKVGYTSTAMFGDGEKEWLNDKKMTMLGRFFTQKMLRTMVNNKCDIALVETTSEGIVQHRHRFINYDIVLFSGLYPEHIESHGSFEEYKQAKLELFRHAERSVHKTLKGKEILKTIIVNHDNEHARDFLNHEVDQKLGYSVTASEMQFASAGHVRVLRAHDITTNETGVTFGYHNTLVQTQLLGEYNVQNIMAAFSIGEALDMDTQQLVTGIGQIKNIPGRLEKIDEGQDYAIVVDYAFEPRAMSSLYSAVEHLKSNKIIHVLGGTGGGRDKARRGVIGAIAGEKASIVIVTDEDPYDEDPQSIMEDVAKGAQEVGKVHDQDLLMILDRREAIEKALELASSGDLVLITGKGCEQGMCVAGGKTVSWDDREIVKTLLRIK